VFGFIGATPVGKEIKFSLILPVCHGENFLRNSLQSICGLEFPADLFETIIISSEVDPVSRKIVEEKMSSADFEMISITIADTNRSTQLNAGCQKARGHILVFVDDDCLIRKDMLKKLSEVFERESNIGIVGGQDELEQTDSAFDLALDEVLNSFMGTAGLRRNLGPRVGKYYPKLWNMAVPRDVALDVSTGLKNGVPVIFNESLQVHEDVDLANRIEDSGRQIIYAPEVRIGHSRDTTLRSFIMRNFAMAYFTALLASSLIAFMKIRKIRTFALIPVILMSLHFARGVGYLIPLNGRRTDEDSLQ